jgi:hypothetical protein
LSDTLSKGASVTGLLEHIEKYLGVIESGWSFKDEVGDVQVVKVSDCPIAGVVAYSTIGMSWTELAMPNDRLAITVTVHLIHGSACERAPRQLSALSP